MMLTELIENFLNLYSSDDDSDAVERVSEREIILHESYTPERITINTNIGGASAGWRRKNDKGRNAYYQIDITFNEIGYKIYEVYCTIHTHYGQFGEVVFTIDCTDYAIEYEWIYNGEKERGELTRQLETAIETVKIRLTAAMNGEIDEEEEQC